MLFADDFVGESDSEKHLQKLIDVIHGSFHVKSTQNKANSFRF